MNYILVGIEHRTDLVFYFKIRNITIIAQCCGVVRGNTEVSVVIRVKWKRLQSNFLA